MATRNKDQGKEVAVPEKKGIVPGIERIDDEAMLAELEGVEGAGGSDNVDDRGTALLYIAQKGSPQVDKKKVEKYVPGLEVGDVFNNLTGEFFKAEGEGNGLPILPCFYRKNYVQWHPDRGGYVGTHPRDTPLLKQAKPWVNPNNGKERGDILELPNGDTLVETDHFFCVLPHNWSTIVIPMSSTNLGAARKMNSLIDAQKAQTPKGFVTKPAFWSLFNLQTVYRDDGDNQWYSYVASIVGKNEDPELRAFCKAYALACMRNEVKVAAPTEGGEGAAASDEDSAI